MADNIRAVILFLASINLKLESNQSHVCTTITTITTITTMSDSASDFKVSSTDAASSVPTSPRKRRRSASADSVERGRARKYHLEGRYNDAYRILYNNDVRAAAARFVVDDSFHPDDVQIGAVRWSTAEKNIFFAALARLGKHDLPGIASAVETKSVPEVRQLLLLLQAAWRGDAKGRVTFQDMPAAFDVDPDCDAQLEVAGDALAWLQENHEMRQEQARHGDYWLITPELADQLEEALKPQLEDGPVSSPNTTEAEGEKPAPAESPPEPQILQEIPEAKLLNAIEMLRKA